LEDVTQCFPPRFRTWAYGALPMTFNAILWYYGPCYFVLAGRADLGYGIELTVVLPIVRATGGDQGLNHFVHGWIAADDCPRPLMSTAPNWHQLQVVELPLLNLTLLRLLPHVMAARSVLHSRGVERSGWDKTDLQLVAQHSAEY